MSDREIGFYWVRLGAGWTTQGIWVVAEFEARGWQVVDEPTYYADADFDEIDDARLLSLSER